MLKHNKLQQNDDKNTVGSIVAGLVGAVAIAGAAVAAAIALKDKKTREKVKQTLTHVKDQAIDYVDTFDSDSNVGKGNRAIKKIAKKPKKIRKEMK